MLYSVLAHMGGRVKHIGRGRYCLFLQKGFARTQLRRMSVNNVRAFVLCNSNYLYYGLHFNC